MRSFGAGGLRDKKRFSWTSIVGFFFIFYVALFRDELNQVISNGNSSPSYTVGPKNTRLLRDREISHLSSSLPKSPQGDQDFADNKNTKTDYAAYNDKAQLRDPNSFLNIVSNENEFLQQYPGEWIFAKNPDASSISTITGGLIGGVADQPDGLRLLAQQIAPLLKARPEEIGDQTLGTDSTLSRIAGFDQLANGFLVYDGSVDFQIRKSDSAIFVINNQLRPVTDFDRNPRLNANEAIQRLAYSLSAKETEFKLRNKQLVVYAKANQKSELAWVIIRSRAPFDPETTEYVVSAVDATILDQRSLTIID